MPLIRQSRDFKGKMEGARWKSSNETVEDETQSSEEVCVKIIQPSRQAFVNRDCNEGKGLTN